MALTLGTQLGLYKILAPLGAGGMGEVYRARDLKLGREVAVKVLHANFANDPERLARFEREARLLAALNHPNIAGIYSVEEHDGVRFLVMELVPGQTLAEQLADGPLPLDQALAVCGQIAEALQAAHANGIIHRDLKPANVKVTPAGKVKLLDFGLAKSRGVEVFTDGLQPPTVSYETTREGVILGTPTYMSPEQARGKPLDQRTDIWAWGCVLYETLAGRRVFIGETVSDVLAAVLEREPDWSALPRTTPARIRGLLQRCLHKDLKRRIHDIRDVLREIEQAAHEPSRAESRPGLCLPKREQAKSDVPTVLPVLETTPAAIPPMVLPADDEPRRPRRSRRKRLTTWAIVGVVFLGACLGGLIPGVSLVKSWFTNLSLPWRPADNSVAVLPFDSGSLFRDDELGRLSDSLAVSINQQLTQTAPGLKVTSQASASKHVGDRPSFAAKFLHVRWIVTGKIERRADGILVRAELVDATNDVAIWWKEYPALGNPDGERGRSLALDNVARDIAEQVRGQLTSKK
jgi:serine/threonine protein kinase